MQVRRGRPVYLPDVALVAVALPVVLRALTPPVPQRFVRPLVVRTPQHEPVLGPDDRRAPVPAGLREDVADCRPFLAAHADVKGALDAGKQVASPAPAERLPLV